jgi:capsular polysaccharide biosynthesis protein
LTLEEQVRLVWRRRVWWIGISALVAGLAFVLAQQRESTYRASAVVSVTPSSVIGGDGVSSDAIEFATMQLDRLVDSDAVLSAAAAAVGSTTAVDKVRRRVSSSADVAAGTVSVQAEAAAPDDAARLASAVAQTAITRRQAEQNSTKDATLDSLRRAQEAARAEIGRTNADSPEREAARLEYQSIFQQIVDVQAAPADTLEVLRAPTPPRAPIDPPAAGIAIFAFLVSLVVGAEGIVIASRRRPRGTSGAVAAGPTAVEGPQTAQSFVVDPDESR